MSTYKVKTQISGRWAWREYGPACPCDLDDLRGRALTTNPEGIDVFRFIAWVEAEFCGGSPFGMPRGASTLAKYRRFLSELNADHEPPPHADDCDVRYQPPRLDPRIKKPIAGPWDWQRLVPRCQCELDSLRIRAAAAFTADRAPGVHLGRFLRWVEGQARHDADELSSSTLAKYRRFLWELNVDHERAHAGDVVLADLECAFEREATTVGAGEGNLTEP